MRRFVDVICLLSTGLLISLSWETAYGTSYRHVETVRDLEKLERSIMLYAADHHHFPSTADGLDVLRSEIDPPIKEASMYASGWSDSWGNDYEYRYPPEHGTQRFDLWSIGRNGLDEQGEGDDLTNWSDTPRVYQELMRPAWPEIALGALVLDLPALLLLLAAYRGYRWFRARGNESNPPLEPTPKDGSAQRPRKAEYIGRTEE